MRIAIIDVGTNNFNYIVAEKSTPKPQILHSGGGFVFLGEGGIEQRFITPAATERALTLLKEFKKIFDEWQCEKIYAVATSAVRNATNKAEFVDKIWKETAIAIEAIEGDEEAELIFKGVKNTIIIPEKSLIMDIGGGSVEFIICNGNEIFWRKSFEIGAQRMLYQYHNIDPIPLENIASMAKFLDRQLQPFLEAMQHHQVGTFIGSAGAFITLFELYSKGNNLPAPANPHEFEMPLEDFKKIHNDLIIKNKAERTAMRGMIAGRVGMIVVSSCMVDYVLRKFEFKKVHVTTASLREGVMFKVLG